MCTLVWRHVTRTGVVVVVVVATTVVVVVMLVMMVVVVGGGGGGSSQDAGRFDVRRGDQLFPRSDPEDGTVVRLLRVRHLDGGQGSPRHRQLEQRVLLQQVQEVGKVATGLLVSRAHQ